MRINKLCLLNLILPLCCFSQTFKGKVIDKVTQQPIETVSVYFDNTTIGTTTDENGKFSITYTDAIQSTLVISYLGYEKVLISDYKSRNNIVIKLVEATSALDEVYIEYDDGLTRRQKLKLFRKEFLGTSKFAKSCRILNEDDLILRYNSQKKTLYASSKVPVKIINKDLKYEISFDIIDFEVTYNYVDTKTRTFNPKLVAYTGTSFYKNLEGSKKRKTTKKREDVYKGSIQHFIRSLYNENLEAEGYLVFYEGFRVNEWSYFKLESIVDSDLKKVSLKDRVLILFEEKEAKSELQTMVDEFFIDVYGNYTPIIEVAFTGAMGIQRLGDTLPLDYDFKK